MITLEKVSPTDVKISDACTYVIVSSACSSTITLDILQNILAMATINYQLGDVTYNHKGNEILVLDYINPDTCNLTLDNAELWDKYFLELRIRSGNFQLLQTMLDAI